MNGTDMMLHHLNQCTVHTDDNHWQIAANEHERIRQALVIAIVKFPNYVAESTPDIHAYI